MKLEKAIEYIETRANDLEFQGFDREAQAQRLGIEALNVIVSARFNSNGEWPPPLPGETED